VQATHSALNGVNSAWSGPIAVSFAPSGQAVSGIAIDPVNTATVIAVYPGISGSSVIPSKHVFLTANNGLIWNNISGTPHGGDNNLPDLPLYAVVIVPNTLPHTIIVGSDAGVMQSADNGQTWQVLGQGLPTVRVTALALDSETSPPLLRAATYGRSAFELVGPSPPQDCFVAVLGARPDRVS
jgi:hypothetical protein